MTYNETFHSAAQARAARPITWLGKQTCDFCDRRITTILYDGATTSGPWAVMCHPCWQTNGRGLGIGKGQKYRLDKTTGEFTKVARKVGSRP